MTSSAATALAAVLTRIAGTSGDFLDQFRPFDIVIDDEQIGSGIIVGHNRLIIRFIFGTIININSQLLVAKLS